MQNFLRSKFIAWVALFLIVVVIITTFRFRPAWWYFFDEFFAFMMVFSWLASLYIIRFNKYAAKTLRNFAGIFGILTVVSLIVEFFLMEYMA